MTRWIAAVVVSLLALDASAALPDFFEIETGWISGMALDGDSALRAYLGLPYAEAPVGELRWKPPAPPPTFDALYEAIEYGPACAQTPFAEGSFWENLNEELDEDCLYLNVWTEAATPDDKRPVMVWIHGGAFTRGSGAWPRYDGAALAQKGVVVVTLNYRLGVFGFLAHPALNAESEDGVSGNYAILDQIAALRWVQRNIGTFGGDPDNVTIFGESAGSWAVSALLAAPSANGLYHRAIGQSGAFLGDMASLAEASTQGASLLSELGANDAAAMRTLPVARLLEAAGAPGAFSARPIFDGHVFPDVVGDVFRAGGQARVSVLLGSNADEGTAFPTALRDSFLANVEKSNPGFLDTYPEDDEDGSARALLDAFRDGMFTCPMRQWADASENAYLYYFTRAPLHAERERYGAYHGSDISYVFRTLDARAFSADETDDALAETMSSYWVNFATTGDPNGDGLPPWPAYTTDGGAYLELGDDVRSRSHLNREACDFLEVSR